MRIHDTLSGTKKELLIQKLRIYLCGVTVYDESHVGHARTIIVFDVLRRYLQHLGASVELVQNFTDIDDKIISRARMEGTGPEKISAKYIGHYFDDFDRLNVGRATVYPKATEHMGDIIEFIQALINNNMAYVAKNGVYFAVSQFPGYGKLSKKDTGQLRSGARVEVDEAKDDPLDFAVWKFVDSGPAWESPWGAGRPGWHIECSAMSTKYLGHNFEIHGGGRDLIFPHHENEIAQSESCINGPLAKIWMHVGMVTINGEKMSKSLGNISTVKQVLEDWGPNVTRLFCLSSHYSKPLDYSKALLGENLTKWRQAEACFYELIHADAQHDDISNMAAQFAREFDAALEDDFNTHLALSSFFALVKEINRLAAEDKLGLSSKAIMKDFLRMLCILGLRMQKTTDAQKDEIDAMVSDREKLRQKGRFAEADRIRDRLNEMNIEMVDHKSRTVWIKKERIKADA